MQFGKKLSFIILLVFISGMVAGQSKKIIRLPNIEGFQTLKCDFNVHTVFSDGTVWPTVRVEEAWREGLDAIAISDNIDYRPHSADIDADHNRAYDIAAPMADALNITLVRAAEITSTTPPGHLNALFIENANLLDREDVFDAVQEARDQGAFLVWNHPGEGLQQTDSVLWTNEHTQLLNGDLLHGIEVFSNTSFYPEAFNWANEKNLTVLSNSNLQEPSGMTYELITETRPLTLVFARDRSREAIKSALVNRRTLAMFDNKLAGSSQFLEPLFFSSLQIEGEPLELENRETVVVEITNNSDIDYELELVQPPIGFDAPGSVVLKAQHVTPVQLSGNSPDVAAQDDLEVFYIVKNALVGPDDYLVVTLSFQNSSLP